MRNNVDHIWCYGMVIRGSRFFVLTHNILCRLLNVKKFEITFLAFSVDQILLLKRGSSFMQIA